MKIKLIRELAVLLIPIHCISDEKNY